MISLCAVELDLEKYVYSKLEYTLPPFCSVSNVAGMTPCFKLHRANFGDWLFSTQKENFAIFNLSLFQTTIYRYTATTK
jgi:hypothetical protein